jgi:hypothetical protein
MRYEEIEVKFKELNPDLEPDLIIRIGGNIEWNCEHGVGHVFYSEKNRECDWIHCACSEGCGEKLNIYCPDKPEVDPDIKIVGSTEEITELEPNAETVRNITDEIDALKVDKPEDTVKDALNNFWKWMEDKGYCNKNGFCSFDDPVINTKHWYPIGKKSQEIIGYMIEYLITELGTLAYTSNRARAAKDIQLYYNELLELIIETETDMEKR